MSPPAPRKHPIQLRSVLVKELSIKSIAPPDRTNIGERTDVRLTPGWSEYNAETKNIAVRLTAEIRSVDDSGEPIEGALFDLLVELMGVFEVVNDDPESGFNVEFIKQWARENAPMILYPYVREQMYGLTSRAGYSGVILPLMELPTIKFPSPTEARSS